VQAADFGTGLSAADFAGETAPTNHQAADLIADPQVRDRGTIGGSLANADPAADWPAVAIAVNAGLELAGQTGRRHVAAKDFFVDIMTTGLEPDEVLVAIHIPRPNPGARFRYRKIHHPASGYAVVGVAVSLPCAMVWFRKSRSASPARPAMPSGRLP